MPNNTNTQLRENPQLQRMPKSERDWVQFMNELVKWVTDLDVRGRLTSDKILPQVLLGNMGSVQTTIPVTATDAGSTITINIASHVLSRSSGNVSYNAGSIIGLDYDTRYFIYADDPTFAGGAVTYKASKLKTDIVSDLGRYFISDIRTPKATLPDNTGGIGGGLYHSQSVEAFFAHAAQTRELLFDRFGLIVDEE